MSLIVPVLNEERVIIEQLDAIQGLPGRWETIVVDGGSTDRTVELIRAHPAAVSLIQGRGGRAAQLNAGAAVASGEVLLFLHADARLPPGAHGALRAALNDPEVIGGNFALRFTGADRLSQLLTLWCALQRRLGVYHGSSAIWLRRDVFIALRGFAALEVMEDYEMARRLERAGRTACLAGPVLASARRWQRGGLLRALLSWTLVRWLFLARVPTRLLAKLKPSVR